MNRYKGITAAALAAAVWVLPAAAQDDQQQAQQNAQQRQQDNQRQTRSQQRDSTGDAQQSESRSQSIRVTGRLTRTRTFNINGQPRVLGILETRRGNTLAVDLGTPQEFRKLKAQRNQTVQAVGRPGRINQRPVLVAEQVRSGEASVRPKRPMTRARRSEQQMVAADRNQSQSGQSSQQQQQNSQTMSIVGELIDTREVQLQRQQGKHLLAKVRTPDRGTVIADLGRPGQLQDLQLSKGELVAVIGRAAWINDRPIIVAEFAADVKQIARSGDAQGAQMAAQREQSQPQQPQQRQRQPQQLQSQQPQQKQGQQGQKQQQKQQEGQRAGQDIPLSQIAPFIGKDTAFIAQVALGPAEAARARSFIGGVIASADVPESSKQQMSVQATMMMSLVKAWADEIQRAGADRVFIVGHLHDGQIVPMVVVPAAGQEQQQRIQQLLKPAQQPNMPATPALPTATAVLHDAVVLTTKDEVQRLQQEQSDAGGVQPFRTAMADVSSASAQILIRPSEQLRQTLQQRSGGATGKVQPAGAVDFTESAEWVAIGIDYPNEPQLLKVVINATSPQKAQEIAKGIGGQLAKARQALGGEAQLASQLQALEPTVKEDRILITVTKEEAAGLLQQGMGILSQLAPQGQPGAAQQPQAPQQQQQRQGQQGQ